MKGQCRREGEESVAGIHPEQEGEAASCLSTRKARRAQHGGQEAIHLFGCQAGPPVPSQKPAAAQRERPLSIRWPIGDRKDKRAPGVFPVLFFRQGWQDGQRSSERRRQACWIAHAGDGQALYWRVGACYRRRRRLMPFLEGRRNGRDVRATDGDTHAQPLSDGVRLAWQACLSFSGEAAKKLFAALPHPPPSLSQPPPPHSTLR